MGRLLFPWLFVSGCFAAEDNTTLVRGQVFYGTDALSGALAKLQNPSTTLVTTSADNGEYRFSNVPPGSYTLLITTDSWSIEGSASLSITVSDPGKSPAPQVVDQLLDPIQLTPAGALSGLLDASAVSGATLEGTAIDIAGTAFEAYADALGNFAFARLPVGLYQVSAIGATLVSQQSVAVAINAGVQSSVTIVMQESAAAMEMMNHPPHISGLVFAVLPGAGSNPIALFDTSHLQPLQMMRGVSASFTCNASDPDGDPLTYSWQISGGVQTQISDSVIDWTSDGGAASVRCTVTDGQGAFDTQSLSVEVMDYRMSGAAFCGTGLVAFSQSDGGVPDFDLVLYDVDAAADVRLSASGNQIGPHAVSGALVYSSDALGTANNPYDVYGRTLPSGAEIRLSSSDGSEAYDIGPAGVAVAHNQADCTIGLRAGISGGETTVFPSVGGGPAPGAVCDRVVVGQTSILFREALPEQSTWRLLDLGTGAVANAPSGWQSDPAIVATYDNGNYLFAIPSLGNVYGFSEAVPFLTLNIIGALPELSSTVVASVVGSGTLVAWSAFDTSGLYGNIRGTLGPTGVNVPTQSAVSVLGVSDDRWILYGVPQSFESPPGHQLWLYDLRLGP